MTIRKLSRDSGRALRPPLPGFRRLAAVLMIPLLAASLHAAEAPTNAASSPQEFLTRADMESDLAYLTTGLKRDWAYAEDKHAFLGVDLEALHATALRELDNTHDADGFYFLLERYVGGLMDGHTAVMPRHWSPGISNPWRWPFSVARLNGRFYIKTFEGKCAPLRPGDELLSINGVAVRDQFEATLAISFGSTPGGRAYRALDAMRRNKEKSLRIEAIRFGGSNFVCELPALPNVETGEEEPIRWKRLEGEVGYLRLPSFRQDMKVWEAGGRSYEALLTALESKKTAIRKAFAELRDTRALILDLRGNEGGSDALGYFLANCLCDTQAHQVYYSLATHKSEDLAKLPDFAGLTNLDASAPDVRSPTRLILEKDVQRYRGKLAVLMDEGCFSACDCFLNYLWCAAPETVFVGRPPGAGAGAPRPVLTLPHSGMVVTFCVMQVWNPNGQLVESRPLKPTVPVEWTAADLAQGRDPDLEAARRALETSKNY